MRSKSLPKLTNYTFKLLSLGLLVFYIINNLKNNIYEVLFIDERLLIDDIYNVWLIEDVYDRFSNVSNKSLKNILIIFIELAYGGDLRYGRLWSNFFTIIAGPAIFLSDTVVIIFSRILNSLLFFSGAYYLSKNLVEKKFLWLSVFTIYSFSQVEILHRVPKPEPMSMLFIAVGMKYLISKKYYHSIFFMAIASFLKINVIVIFFFIWVYIFLNSNLNRVQLIFKSILITLGGLFVVNPILLIPPLKIGGNNLPNFYKIYFNWLTTQGSNADEIAFNFSYAKGWIEKFSNFYNFPNTYFFIIVIGIIFGLVFREIIKSSDSLSKYLLIIFCFYIFFYFFFLERVWTRYLHLPLALFLIAFLRTLYKKNKTFIPVFLISTFALIGNISNMERYLSDTTFFMNERLDYVSVETQEDAEVLVSRVIDKIRLIYEENEHLNKNKVFWHPDLITPRNKVTYSDSFYVREYWGNKDKVDFAIEEGDIFVTYTNYETSELIMKTNIENFFIYYYKK
tara:strand:+ start:442 stop:1968 length:1527 start_codon:yes stop_codon:yes gene_type:complete